MTQMVNFRETKAVKANGFPVLAFLILLLQEAQNDEWRQVAERAVIAYPNALGLRRARDSLRKLERDRDTPR